MSYAVDIYADNKLLATGEVRDGKSISDLKPFEGRGMGYGRHVQITVTTGKHVGQTITARIEGEADGNVILQEPMPWG